MVRGFVFLGNAAYAAGVLLGLVVLLLTYIYGGQFRWLRNLPTTEMIGAQAT